MGWKAHCLGQTGEQNGQRSGVGNVQLACLQPRVRPSVRPSFPLLLNQFCCFGSVILAHKVPDASAASSVTEKS